MLIRVLCCLVLRLVPDPLAVAYSFLVRTGQKILSATGSASSKTGRRGESGRLSVSIALICLIGCLQPTDGHAETFRVMLSNDSFPPFYFAKDDKRTGIDRDLLQAIGNITHDTFIFVYLPFLRAQYMFDCGDIDIETCVNPSWRKGREVPGIYTVSHSKTENILLFGQGKRISVKIPEDLYGGKVGIVRGYCYPKFDALFDQGVITKFSVSDELHLFKMLRLGRVDQAFMNKTLALYWMRQDPDLSSLELGDVVREDDLMIRLHPDKQHALPRFNAAIRQLQESGEIDRIYAKYQ